MQTDHQDINQIIANYLCGELNDEEQVALNNWLEDGENRQFFEELTNPQTLLEELRRYHRYNHTMERERLTIWEKYEQHQNEKPRKRRSRRYAIAAVIVLLLSVGGYYWLNRPATIQPNIAETKQADSTIDALPGSYKATLTLADGHIVVLDSTVAGDVIQQGTAVIINSDNKLVYSISTQSADNGLLYNSLATAKGQTYQIELADGSKAWLNAGSSIRYPVAFTGNERKVEISGEVYFEVAKDKSRPFKAIVRSGRASQTEVQVLGTHFNINAYDDENAIRTTLLEGSIKLKRGREEKVISPHQQAIINAGSDKIIIDEKADEEKAVAWKNGLFNFKNDDLQTIMRQMARWYKVDVKYEGNIPNEIYTGTFKRNINLAQALEILQFSSQLQLTKQKQTIILKLKPKI